MFITSSTYDYPTHSLPEVALVGRSNAGKSSFLNSISSSSVAKVSKTPGKTSLLNFFNMKSYVLVDMPGYGYAKRSKKEILKWKSIVENYLLNRNSLVLIVLLMDIRRKFTDDEMLLVKLAKQRSIQIFIILSKADKLKEASSHILEIKNASGIENVFIHSSKTKEGVVDIKKRISNEVNKLKKIYN